MSNLNDTVSRHILSLLHTETGGEGNDYIELDVLRSLRDQSKLLYERQLICEALDADPLYSYRCHPEDDNDDEEDKAQRCSREMQVQQMKKCIKVISCERMSTHDGYSCVHAVIELIPTTYSDNILQSKQDESSKRAMRDSSETVVEKTCSNIRLTIKFERQPQQQSDDVTDVASHVMDPCNVEPPTRDCNISPPTDANDKKRKREEFANEMDANAHCSIESSHIKSFKNGPTERGNRQQQKISTDEEVGTGTRRRDIRAQHRSRTKVTYDIDISEDYGKCEKLLFVQVIASNNAPSLKGSRPMNDDEVNRFIFEPHSNQSRYDGKDRSRLEIEDGIEPGVRGEEVEANTKLSCIQSDAYNVEEDIYAGFVDPDELASLQRFMSLMSFDEESMVLLLMTLPFYEHEFDIVGFLLNCLFADSDSEVDSI